MKFSKIGSKELGLNHQWYTTGHGRKISYYLRKPSNSKGPKLLLLHATGFHAMIWLSVIRKLPKNWGVLSIDAPGHGLSHELQLGAYAWSQVADDAALICKHHQWSKSLVIGHSMGGLQR